MPDAPMMLNLILLAGLSAFFVLLGWSSFLEKEYRAAGISALLTLVNLMVWAHFIFRNDSLTRMLNAWFLAGLAVFALISLIRYFPESDRKSGGRDMSRAGQFDERDTMFARNNLKNHPELMTRYYTLRPENASTDRQIHSKPDFGNPRQFYHDPYTAPCFLAAFEYMEKTIPLSDGTPSAVRQAIDPGKMAHIIGQIILFYGGCDTGIIETAPYHFYSRRGRHGHHWGKETDQTCRTAIVIIVPMRAGMLRQAPTASVIQESAQKYVEAAKISNVLAGFIRRFGYRARAHNDANYDTLCVPLAVESGLGELGRMGIFMHRVHGPCVRIAVVTTDMELTPTPRTADPSMAAFCRICKKCADNCPSGSITHGDEPASRGFRHWSINQEKCFSYWKTIGSDCGMCIAVCPYTKPDTAVHRLVRFYISRNPLNQRIALFMDDLLYGRKRPLPRTNPVDIFQP